MVDSLIARLDLKSRITRFGWIAYGIALAVVVIDQITKAWVLGALQPGDSVAVLPFFHITLVWNPGITFGMLAAGGATRWLLVLFAAAAVTAAVIWARSLTKLLPATALGLIIGGAIGNNIIDRVRWGRVTDFLDFSGLAFPWVFNVADTAIDVGVALLLVEILFLEGRTRAQTPPS
jgi:signal peptidase II